MNALGDLFREVRNAMKKNLVKLCKWQDICTNLECSKMIEMSHKLFQLIHENKRSGLNFHNTSAITECV